MDSIHITPKRTDTIYMRYFTNEAKKTIFQSGTIICPKSNRRTKYRDIIANTPKAIATSQKRKLQRP